MNTEGDRLRAILLAMGQVAVACSGGLDSSVLLAFAARVLGSGNCLAITVSTPYMMSNELEDARSLCRQLDVAHRVMELPVIDAVRMNPADRCYHCKKYLFTRIRAEALQSGCLHVADGTNLDDDGDYRPGRKALVELGIASPLREAGMGKREIRALGRELELERRFTEKPPYACLLTRLEHHAAFSEQDLERIDRAEQILRELGFGAVRVRTHGDIARIELSPEMHERVLGRREHITSALLKLGYRHVTLDLRGYRQGSMNIEESAS